MYGITKVPGACHIAADSQAGCINKDSSAELSEAINSMYAWYRDAFCCFVHLADVPSGLDPNSPRQQF